MSGLAAAALANGGESLATVRWALRRSIDLLAPDTTFFVWNSVLAVVPLFLALPLSVAPRRTAAWWCGVVAFVLFLPNAPYVLTDGVHFLDHVRDGASNLAVFGALVPAYLAFFALGFGSYVICVRTARRYVVDVWGGRVATVVVLGLHATSAVGMYLGRIPRLNSWDAVTAPHSVAANLEALTNRLPALVVTGTFVALVAGTLLTEACVDGLRARWQEHRTLV